MICAELLFFFSSYLQQCYGTNTCIINIKYPGSWDQILTKQHFLSIKSGEISIEKMFLLFLIWHRDQVPKIGIALTPPHISKRCALAGENVVNNHRNFHFKTQLRFDKTRESSEMGNVNNRNCNAHLLMFDMPVANFSIILHTFWRHASQEKICTTFAESEDLNPKNYDCCAS